MMRGLLAKKLRVLRAERGWKLKDVEARSGVAHETLSRIESGQRRPMDSTLAKLARAYGVPLDELIAIEDEPAPKKEAPQGSAQAELRRRVDSGEAQIRFVDSAQEEVVIPLRFIGEEIARLILVELDSGGSAYVPTGVNMVDGEGSRYVVYADVEAVQ